MIIKYKDKKIELKEGTKISVGLKKEIENSEYQVIAAKFNNEYKNLQDELNEDGTIEFIDISSAEGMKVYKRTLVYIMGKAFEECYPKALITVNYQLNNAMFCDIDNMKVTDEIVKTIKNKMKEIIEKDLEIKKVVMTREKAKEFYEEKNTSRGKLQLDLKDNQEIYMYFCEDYFNYCYGTLANKTSCTKVFDMEKYSDGFLIRFPSTSNPDKVPKYHETKKLSWALNEYDDIHKLLNLNTVYKLNKAIKEKRIQDIIMLDEALHEKKIAQIADNIVKNRKVKMILIAGPSSSGKTTFAKRLGVQLRLNGLKPVTISVDNYFVERDQNPKDENGEYDFECLEAIDLDLFNDHLLKLLNGEEIDMPEFDFVVGTKRYNGKKMSLAKDEVLVIEGIHCLNDKLTSRIPKEQKYKIYISALTVLKMDYYNRISTTDTRLIRRIARDNKFRGYSAKHTIATWHKVNKGEVSNIFPFQEEADSIFNTSLIYELAALKDDVMPLLEEIDNTNPEYAEAQRLINMLKYFESIPKNKVPINSLLREFLGGSVFED